LTRAPPPPHLQGAKGLAPTSWAEALSAVQAAVGAAKGNEIKAIAGKLTDAETMVAVKDLLNRLGSGNMRHEDDTGPVPLSGDVRST
jgi:hypothetical protein